MKIVRLNILVEDEVADKVASNLYALISSNNFSLEEDVYDDQILEKAVSIVDFGTAIKQDMWQNIPTIQGFDCARNSYRANRVYTNRVDSGESTKKLTNQIGVLK